jgi:hypothetical protein
MAVRTFVNLEIHMYDGGNVADGSAGKNAGITA